MFIFLGSFPYLCSLRANNQEVDLSDLAGKYESSDNFISRNNILCRIDENSVNEATIKLLKNDVSFLPLSSLAYLASNRYSNIIIDHRLVLLLHVIEGIVTQNQRQEVCQEYKTIFLSNPNDKTSKHKLATYYLCKNYFFKYHRKYNCEIIQLLNKTQKSFVDICTNTRNWYSHFSLNFNGNAAKSKSKIDDGFDMNAYFMILFTAIRLLLCSNLNVPIIEKNVKESYYYIHDLIILKKKLDPDKYKSLAYMFSRDCSNMNVIINQIDAVT